MGFIKKDALLATTIGLLVSLLALIVVKNLGLVLPFNKYLLPLVFPPLAAAGLYVLFKVSLVWRPFVYQFGKFFLVGSLNTFLDLGLLNLLIFFSNITAGVWFSVFKGITFVAAVINSYFWNKLWTFEARQGSFATFFAVVSGGFLINVGIASLLVNVIGAPAGISAKVWDNIAALSSLVFVLTWNFLGMKFLVFRRKKLS